MHSKQNYGGLDSFRIIAALLVVAIHTSPLAAINEGADFFLTRVLARIAVPFFFMVTGQFVITGLLNPSVKSIAKYHKYLLKTALLYLFCILIYLPIGIYAGHYKELTFPSALRMLLFDGTFYHLWYFPACILGVLLVRLMSRFLSLGGMTVFSAVLYIIGLFGDSYFGLIQDVPALNAVYEFGFRFFSYTRNGFFLAPLFLVLGAGTAIEDKKNKPATPLPDYIGLAVSFAIMTTEAFLLRHYELQRHDSMYLALVPTIIFLYRCLLYPVCKPSRFLRTCSTWVYMLHPAFIVVIRGMAKPLRATELLVENNLVHYFAVALLTVAASFFVTFLQKKLQLPLLLSGKRENAPSRNTFSGRRRQASSSGKDIRKSRSQEDTFHEIPDLKGAVYRSESDEDNMYQESFGDEDILFRESLDEDNLYSEDSNPESTMFRENFHGEDILFPEDSEPGDSLFQRNPDGEEALFQETPDSRSALPRKASDVHNARSRTLAEEINFLESPDMHETPEDDPIYSYVEKTAEGSRAWAEIDLEALEQNVAFFRERLPENCRLMPAVKADAYGHGAVAISRHLNRLGVDAFCVACVSEGMELREAGIRGEILILGYTSPEEFPLLCRFRLTQTVVDYSYARLLSCFIEPIHVHIGIDTGMHRIGIRCENMKEILAVYKLKNLIIDGLFTHLCVSDSPLPEHKAFTESQIHAFFEVTDILKAKGYPCAGLHMLASYGILNLLHGRETTAADSALPDEARLAGDYVRPGIALYGAFSTVADSGVWNQFLHPLLSLKAKVVSVRPLYAGEAVGYGITFTAEQDMRIAAISIGYADGLPRCLSQGKGNVLINGYKVPIIGRICMDQTMVDVSRIPRVEAGDTAVIIGRSGTQEITVEQIAGQCDTIAHEILTGLNARVERIYHWHENQD